MRWITIAAGTLPLRKPGMLQLPAERGRGALEARLDLLARHLGVEAHAGVGQLGDCGLDGHGRGAVASGAMKDRGERIAAPAAVGFLTGSAGRLTAFVIDVGVASGALLGAPRDRQGDALVNGEAAPHS